MVFTRIAVEVVVELVQPRATLMALSIALASALHFSQEKLKAHVSSIATELPESIAIVTTVAQPIESQYFVSNFECIPLTFADHFVRSHQSLDLEKQVAQFA